MSEPLATTTAEVISLVIPLGLLLLTMAWLGWQIHVRHRSAERDVREGH